MKIEKWQKKHGLVDDGIIGKKTTAKMREVWKLNKVELAHFLGQLAHETANFIYDEENLNYSSRALQRVFSKYFPEQWQAELYEYKPRDIANKVYANRMGNGDEESGDGYKYRGRGAIQLTGKNNYERFAQKMNDLCILETPYIVSDKYFWESALFYFNENNIWRYCKTLTISSISKVTRMINGGYNGLEDRVKKTDYYYDIQ